MHQHIAIGDRFKHIHTYRHRHRFSSPFDAHCCHMATAIKHLLPDRVKLSFVIFDTTSFAQQQPYFARVADGVFWCDMERVKVLIDLYEHFDCPWYVKYQEYKNVSSDVAISTAVAYGLTRGRPARPARAARTHGCQLGHLCALAARARVHRA